MAAVAVAALSLLSTRRAAAEEELPSGNDNPRLKPIVVADGYWAFHDTPPAGRQATGLTVGATHHAFSANLVAAGAKLEHARLMGQVVLQFGDSVDNLYQSNGSSLRYLQQASVGYRLGSDVWVEAGVLPSLIGREDWVSARNWNFTHSMVADGTPYYVAGARVGWHAHPTLTLDLTMFNGWWYLPVRDQNNGKAGALHVAWRPGSMLSVDAALVASRENPDSVRLFGDLVVEVRPWKWFTAAVEAWYGREQGFTASPTPDSPAGVENPAFHAAAVWLKFAPFDTTYLALRAEALSDESAILFGYSPSAYPGKMLGGTLTLGWQPHPAMLVRLEALHRRSDKPWFRTGPDEAGKYQYDTQSSSLLLSAALSL